MDENCGPATAVYLEESFFVFKHLLTIAFCCTNSCLGGEAESDIHVHVHTYAFTFSVVHSHLCNKTSSILLRSKGWSY